jgi:hypothetical protein
MAIRHSKKKFNKKINQDRNIKKREISNAIKNETNN